MSQYNKIKKRIRKRVKLIKLFFFHVKQLSFKKQENKRIIICFNGVFAHGGIVDRLKGIISFYEISKMLGYKFYIQFDHPFNLDVFLEENKVFWKIERENLNYHPIHTKLIYLINDFDINPLELLQNSSANTFIVYANVDYLSRLYSSNNSMDNELKWRMNFNELFKKSSLLEDKLKGIKAEKYITFHTRFTSLMGDFKDTVSKVLNTKEKEQLIFQLEQKIQTILNDSPHKCYGFSDSVNFLETIKDKKPIYLVQGKPFHVDDFGQETPIEGHLKTFIDFFMMAESEAVYFLKCGKMYSSSFSKYASILGETPFKIITD